MFFNLFSLVMNLLSSLALALKAKTLQNDKMVNG